MATVIDTLVVELGLDPKKFTAGQRAAVSSAQQTVVQMKKSATEIEKAGEKAADFYRKMRVEALAFISAIAGAAGLTQFLTQLTTADASLGRFSRNLGMSPRDISKWEGAVERAGGTAEDARAAFQHLNDEIQAFAVHGTNNIDQYLQELQQVGGTQIDRLGDKSEQMIAIGENLKKIRDMGEENGGGAAKANYIGRQLGFSPGFVNTLQQGGDAIRAALKESERIGAATEEDIRKAEELAKAWRELVQAFTDAGRAIAREVTPEIKEMLKAFQDFIIANKGDIAQGFRDFIAWVKKEWPEVKQGMKDFVAYIEEKYPAVKDAFTKIADAIDTVSKAVGGLENVTKILLALWAGSKILAIVAALAAAAPALTALAVAAGALLAGYAINELTGGNTGMGGADIDPSEEWDSEKNNRANKLVGQLHNKDTKMNYRNAVMALRARGIGNDEAHGIAANLLGESGFDSSITSPDGGAHGLMQWRGARFDALKAFAAKKNKDWTDRDTQYDFIAHEKNMDKGMATAASISNAGATPFQAGSAYSRYGERHGNPNEDYARGKAAEYGKANLDPMVLIPSGLAGQPLRNSTGAGTSNNVNQEVNIEKVEVHTQATDADGMARDSADALKRQLMVPQINHGLR